MVRRQVIQILKANSSRFEYLNTVLCTKWRASIGGHTVQGLVEHPHFFYREHWWNIITWTIDGKPLCRTSVWWWRRQLNKDNSAYNLLIEAISND